MKNLVFGVVMVLAMATTAFAQVSPTGSWATETPSSAFSFSGSWGASCTDGAYLYYWGTDWDPTAHWKFDPSTNRWSNAPALSGDGIACGYATGVNYGGTGGVNYSFGDGFTGDGSVRKFDIPSQTWTLTSTYIYEHPYRPGVAVAGSYIYVFGGGGYDVVSRFDPSDDSASYMTNMPWGGDGVGAATSSINGKIYITQDTTCWEYTPGGSFATMPNMPTYRYWHTSFASVSGRIYVVGGESGTLVVDEFFPNAGSGTWTRRANALSSHYYGAGSGTFGSTGKCYVWCGAYNNIVEEFSPPAFGVAPNAASNVQQIGSLGNTPQAGADANLGWTDAQIQFQANVSDPDSTMMRFEVQVKPVGAAWSAATTLTTPLSAAGLHSVNYSIPAGGDYDWRYHTVDNFGNFNPSSGGVAGWTEFNSNTVSPDFRSDQVGPTAPYGVYPSILDVDVANVNGGEVTFQWSPATDNGPASAIRYTLEISHNDSTFGTITASAVGVGPKSEATIYLACSPFSYYYRINATDIGGNVSAWSATKHFRVVGNDGENHSAGDASKVCGGSAGATGSAPALLLALSLLVGIRRRK